MARGAFVQKLEPRCDDAFAAYDGIMAVQFLPGWKAMTTGRPVFLVGVIAYVLSWFLPVVPNKTEGVPFRGWDAFLTAIGPVFDPQHTDVCAQALWVLSALTNLLILGAVLIMLGRRAPPPRAVTISLAVAAVLNTYWFFLGGPAWAIGMIPDTAPLKDNCLAIGNEPLPLLAGYYVWLSSFVLVAIASHLHRGGSAARTR
jgi:hypothetical protein